MLNLKVQLSPTTFIMWSVLHSSYLFNQYTTWFSLLVFNPHPIPTAQNTERERERGGGGGGGGGGSWKAPILSQVWITRGDKHAVQNESKAFSPSHFFSVRNQVSILAFTSITDSYKHHFPRPKRCSAWSLHWDKPAAQSMRTQLCVCVRALVCVCVFVSLSLLVHTQTRAHTHTQTHTHTYTHTRVASRPAMYIDLKQFPAWSLFVEHFPACSGFLLCALSLIFLSEYDSVLTKQWDDMGLYSSGLAWPLYSLGPRGRLLRVSRRLTKIGLGYASLLTAQTDTRTHILYARTRALAHTRTRARARTHTRQCQLSNKHAQSTTDRPIYITQSIGQRFATKFQTL